MRLLVARLLHKRKKHRRRRWERYLRILKMPKLCGGAHAVASPLCKEFEDRFDGALVVINWSTGVEPRYSSKTDDSYEFESSGQ